MNKIFSIGLLLTTIFAQNLEAVQIPKNSAKDSRIKYAQYDPSNIVNITIKKNFAVNIVFNKDEIIENAIYGESNNWTDYIDKKNQNHMYIKANNQTVKESNMIIITNKHQYLVNVNVCDDNCKDYIYRLVFSSKNEPSQNKQITEEQIANKLLDRKSNIEVKNYQYTSQGSQEIKPIDAWDNGKFTYLKFSSNKVIPAVYLLQDDATENLVNSHIENKNIVVIHKTAPRFLLRAGKQVLVINNEAFLAENNFNKTSTSSIFVERVIKNDK